MNLRNLGEIHTGLGRVVRFDVISENQRRKGNSDEGYSCKTGASAVDVNRRDAPVYLERS